MAGKTSRCAFSLLEVILALSLATVLIGLLLLATRTFLRAGEDAKVEVERAILARNVLQLIARDLQNIVVPAAQDVSGLSTAKLPSADELAAAAGGDSGTDPGSGSSGGGTSDGGTSRGGSSSRGGGNTSGGGGSSSGGTNSSGNQSSNSNSSTGNQTGDNSDSTDDDSSISSSVESSSETLDVPGVYGNRYELVFDILRTPEFNPYAAAVNGSSAAPQRVSWSVTDNASVRAATGSTANAVGLVRRSQARAAASWASSNGQMPATGTNAPLSNRVAAIEFRYFDGSQWLETWDSAEQTALPTAIEVAVLVFSNAETSAREAGNSNANIADTTNMFAGVADTNASTNQAGKIFRRVVYLPLSGLSPTAAADAAASGAGDTDGESSANSSDTGGTAGTGSEGAR